MPFPGWTPIIGSGFDQDAAQQAHWIGFNAAQDAANIARQNAAQEAQSRWREVASRAQQAGIDTQTGIDLQAQRSAMDQAAAQSDKAEGMRRFDVGTQLTQAQQEIERQRFAFTKEEKNAAEKKALDQMDRAAKVLDPQAQSAGEDLKAASQAEDKAIKDWNRLTMTTPKEIMALKPGSYTKDKHTLEYRAANEKPETIAAVSAANEMMVEAKSELASAKARHDAAKVDYAIMQKNVQGFGLLVTKDHHVYSAAHDKTYGDDETDPESEPTFSGFSPAPSAVPKTGTRPMPVVIQPRGVSSQPAPVVAPPPGQTPPLGGQILRGNGSAVTPAPLPQTQPQSPTNTPPFAFSPQSQPDVSTETQPAAIDATADPSSYKNYLSVLDTWLAGKISKSAANDILAKKFNIKPGDNWYPKQLANGEEWATKLRWGGANPSGIFGNWSRVRVGQ